MSSVLKGVHQHTQLAGHNRTELLMFRLGADQQRYGINVFKVQEVIHCPPLNSLPNPHPLVRGIATIRGRTVPIVDLAKAIGKEPIEDIEHAFVVVTEYNNSIQGYLVYGVDRIVNMRWEDILPPPPGMGPACYMTAVTRIDDEFVEIIDVEKVLQEFAGDSGDAAQVSDCDSNDLDVSNMLILVADDSSVARTQIRRPLDQIGVESVLTKDGREALDLLRQWADDEPEMLQRLIMVISDIEMPKMDGYTLTTEIRKDPRLEHLYILLHSSLSGVFNEAMVESIGADRFTAKYDPGLLAESVMTRIREAHGTQGST